MLMTSGDILARWRVNSEHDLQHVLSQVGKAANSSEDTKNKWTLVASSGGHLQVLGGRAPLSFSSFLSFFLLFFVSLSLYPLSSLSLAFQSTCDKQAQASCRSRSSYLFQIEVMASTTRYTFNG